VPRNAVPQLPRHKGGWCCGWAYEHEHEHEHDSGGDKYGSIVVGDEDNSNEQQQWSGGDADS
jgi:hypothetical protein